MSKKKKQHKDKMVQIDVKESQLIYEKDLRTLQIELLKMQNHIKDTGQKLLIIFEGRDAAGKGGMIKRITEHLNPRGARVVALNKPSDTEKTQWYFQRYTSHLPSAGEIVLFDRSWYNRGGVEPVMGFCTPEEHEDFLQSVPKFERMLINSGIQILKYYISVSKDVQQKRFKERKHDPLKHFKISSVDEHAQELWEKYTVAKYSMLLASHTPGTPWTIVRSDNKKEARINCIKHIISHIEYPEKISEEFLKTNDKIVFDGNDEVRYMESKMNIKIN
ncbi:MAG: polyphosphate kinase 2 [Thiovulaceae bacterium]|nr:polyphosphate kinase 2 [Sulfurimonadaceae bacterium]